MWQDIKNIYHFFVAVLANVVFGFPSRGLKVIGVTGTDGKTTTVSLIYHILKNFGKNVSMISSLGALINGKNYDIGFHVTTPSSFALQKFLRKSKNSGSDYFILEVTSHALDQNRVWGIPFEVGVLTNITKEHLDYHETYDEYLKAKAKLLLNSKTAVINRDDKSYEKILRILTRKPKIKCVTYGIFENSDINLNSIRDLKVEGEFNKQNFLAATAVCKVLDVSQDDIEKALKSFKLPKGRLDVVYDSLFKVVIDFAHTPNAFEQVLFYLRKKVKGRIIHVFGTAGKRDWQKRPEMGEISDKYSDFIVLTSEDPRSENPLEIIDQIKKGIKNGNKIQIVPDRKEAIEYAIKNAKMGDLVLITGKAHEKSMNLGHGEEPWDEYEAVKKALEKKGLSYD